MGEFFAGLAVVFALLLFGKGGRGRGPGALPPGSSGPGNFPPVNPGYPGPPNLPSGPTGSGCGCGSANSYTPPPASQTPAGNLPPAQPNGNAPASYGTPPAQMATPPLKAYTFGGAFGGVSNQITVFYGPNGPYAVAGTQ